MFPVYALKVARAGALGPNLRPATADCVQDIRTRPDLLGPSLHQRGQVVVPFCGIDNTITGPKGYRVTLEQFAHGLRGFGMYPTDHLSAEPEVVDQTGLAGVYDFELNLGFLPLAAIASAHPTVGVGFGPMVRTFPQAIEEQLGLRLARSEAARDVAVIATAAQALQRQAARVELMADAGR